MRVSDRSTARNYLKYLNNAKNNWSKTNQQIASGNRFERISDDVTSGTRVMRSRMDLYKTQVHLDNVKSINEEMSTSETALKATTELLSSAHELALKAMSEDKKEVSKEVLATEIKNLKEQLLLLANTKLGKKYTFGGNNSSTAAPFKADADGKLLYNGIAVDKIERNAAGDGYCYKNDAGEIVPVPMDEKVYMDIGLGIRMKESQVEGESAFLISNSGLDIFGFGKNADDLSNNIYNVLTDLENNIREYDAKKVGELDAHLSGLSDKFRANLTDIGSKTKFLDTMQERLQSNVNSHKTRISSLMATDDAEAATQLAMNDQVLKAVLQMGSRIIPVSLMDFLR